MRAKLAFAEYLNAKILPDAVQRGIILPDVDDEDSVNSLDEEVRFENASMENQMVQKFGVDMLVARYALVSVEYRSIEAAVDIIFGDDSNVGQLMEHPFFGYTPDSY